MLEHYYRSIFIGYIMQYFTIHLIMEFCIFAVTFYLIFYCICKYKRFVLSKMCKSEKSKLYQT